MITRAIRRVMAVTAAAVTVLALGACASGTTASTPIRVGWAGDIPPLDPAASRSVGSFALLSQLYPSLLTVEPGDDEPVPDIAASAEWTEPNVYTIVLKSGLAFANGDALTSSDVKFSIERQLALQSADGAWRQLDGLDRVELIDDSTIAFHLKNATDARFPFVLAGPAGLVLDEETFYADELTADDDILDAQPFAGPYALTERRGERLVFEPYGGYAGIHVAQSPLELSTASEADLASQLHSGSIDVLTGRLDADTIATLADDEALMMSRAASGRVRLLTFDLEYMPFGSRTETADAAKATAVRIAIAELIDRSAIVDALGRNWVRPLSGYLPTGMPAATDVLTDVYGDGSGGPDPDAAAAGLTAAEVEVPVALTLHVDLGQVGEPGSAEVAAIADQLDASGLFDVEVLETDAEGLAAARLAGKTQAVFTSILPANSDPAEYLRPFQSPGVLAPGYADSTVNTLLGQQSGQLDADVRMATLVEVQSGLAAAVPAIPITEGVRVLFARTTIDGFELDDAFPLDLTRLRR